MAFWAALGAMAKGAATAAAKAAAKAAAMSAKAAASAGSKALATAGKAATAIGHGAQGVAKGVMGKTGSSPLALAKTADPAMRAAAQKLGQSVGTALRTTGKELLKSQVGGSPAGETAQNMGFNFGGESVETAGKTPQGGLGKKLMDKMGAMMDNPLQDNTNHTEDTMVPINSPIATGEIETGAAPTTSYGSAPLGQLSEADIQYLLERRRNA